MSDETRDGKKYKEFVKKYRILSKQEEQDLKNQFEQASLRGQANFIFNSMSFSPDKKAEKPDELA
jgi:hypothetical protein